MDSVFLLTEEDRAPFIYNLIHSFGCTYICLWSYNYSPPPHNYLSMKYGYYYNEVLNRIAGPEQPSSSTSAARSNTIAATARTFFEEYRQQSIFLVDNHDRVPGLAFLRSRPYLELREPELHRLSSSEPQRRFYQEAGIKIAVFMGCNSGEIELGMSNLASQTRHLEMEMRNLFPHDFSSRAHESPLGVFRVAQGRGGGGDPPQHLLLPPLDYRQEPSQHRSGPSSSSSIGSPAEYHHPSLFDFTIPSSSPSSPSYYQLEKQLLQEMNNQQQQQLVSTNPLLVLPSTTDDLIPIGIPSTSSSPPPNPHQSAFHQSFPTPESTDSAITRAILAVLSSSSNLPPTTQTLLLAPHPPQVVVGHDQRNPSAFKRYASSSSSGIVGLVPGGPSTMKRGQTGLNRRQNVLKRIVVYLRNLNYRRLQELGGQGSRVVGGSSSSTHQLHHMIMERKRRQKISESFQTLKAMLPPGTKKDKASVLRTTKEYLHTLKSQISELNRRNQILESHLDISTRHQFPSGSSVERQLSVSIAPIVPASPTSSSEDRMIDLYVSLRSLDSSPADVIIRVLEFLKQVRELSVVCMEAQSLPTTRTSDQSSIHRVTMRLRIEGNYQWEESAFLEAVKRVLADMAIQ